MSNSPRDQIIDITVYVDGEPTSFMGWLALPRSPQEVMRLSNHGNNDPEIFNMKSQDPGAYQRFVDRFLANK